MKLYAFKQVFRKSISPDILAKNNFFNKLSGHEEHILFSIHFFFRNRQFLREAT
jgi:hypothetical protein